MKTYKVLATSLLVVLALGFVHGARAQGDWGQSNTSGFGIANNVLVSSLESFDGVLYAGTYNPTDGSQLWRLSGGAWEKVMEGGFGDADNVGVDDLEVFQGQLYAAVWNDADGGEIHRSADGSNWSAVLTGGFGDPTNGEVFRLAVFSDTLYASTWSYTDTHGAEIWRSATGGAGTWERVVENGFGDVHNRAVMSFESFGGYLYASTYNSATGGEVWRSATGGSGTWEQVNGDGFGDGENAAVADLEAFGGWLYASTSRGSGAGAEVWRCKVCDGNDWEQVVDDGFGDAETRRMNGLEVFDGHLYFVVGNFITGLEVWRTADGVDWEQVGFAGFGDLSNKAPYWGNSLTVHGDRFYVGTWNPDDGGEVWAYPYEEESGLAWESNGPFGGDVLSLAVHPTESNILMAGLNAGGAYVSRDFGHTWERMANGLPADASPFWMLFDPVTPDTVYTTDGRTVYKTTDGGETWAEAASGLPSDDPWMWAGAINPITPTILLVGTHEHGVYRTEDGAQNWVSASEGLPNGACVTALAVHPVTPTIVYAATYDRETNRSRVWRSDDGGKTWAATAEYTSTAPVVGLAVSPVDPSVVYVGEGNGRGEPPGDTDGKTFRTTDGGTTWEMVKFWDAGGGNWQSGESWAILFSQDGQTIYLGTRSPGHLYASGDEGNTWEFHYIARGFGQWVLSMALDEGNGYLYVGTKGPGVYVTDDLGSTNWEWDLRSEGLRGITPWDVAAEPGNPQYAYVVTDGSGNFRSVDGGESWEAVEIGEWSFGTTVAIANTVPTATVYVGLPNAVAVSTDRGESWTEYPIPASGNNHVEALVAHPVTATLLYAGLWETVSNTGSVWRSEDGGQTWSALPITATGSISRVEAVAALTDGTLLVGTGGQGIYRSADGGQTWTPSNNGLPNLWVNHLHVSGDVVWAALDDGVASSDDGGQTWTKRGLDGIRVRRVAVDPQNPQVIYAASPESGLYVSYDRGETWQADAGGLGGVPVMAVDAASDGSQAYVYAAVRGGFASAGGAARERRGLAARQGSEAADEVYVSAGVYQKVNRWSWVYLPVVMKGR